MGKKRQKQFEKYLAKKLKKDSRPDLLSRLDQTTFCVDALQSTKNLLVPSRRTGPKPKEIPDPQAEESEESSVESVKPVKRTFVRAIPVESTNLNAAIASIKRSALNPLSDDSLSAETDSISEAETKAVEETSPNALADPLPTWETYYVLVDRSPEIEEQRAKLPIYAEEQSIMETLRNNAVSIICGETGSGKTTQVPQFLYEAGFGDKNSPNPGLIGVTQPRRVAATSMARRVGEELGRPEHVAHQVRYDSEATKETRIKFMTDGILLRELADDFLLNKYSVILLDEAHERNLNTDILIGMLSRAVRLRNRLAFSQPEKTRPLRLVIMSATLNIEEFTSPKLFTPPPPILKVEARQHPVTMHFSKKTPTDHVDAAFRMVCKIHANLPPGGILVFLTGKQEIVRLAQRLNSKYHKRSLAAWNDEDDDEGMGEGFDNIDEDEEYEKAELDSGEEEEEEEFSMGAETREPLYVLPLYSLLAPEEQIKVFQPPPEGSRLCILATNVAETSLTIPNIRYVVDSGLVKQRHFDPSSGAQEYKVEWTSQASATQRSGRAGRVGPGHCYRLFSSAVFDQQFSPFSSPEIKRTPIEGLVLQLKTMGIDHPERFPLPSPPEPGAIIAAQKALLRMGALCASDDFPRITVLGRKMTRIPIAPIWSRLVVLSLEMNESPLLAVALASVMSVGDPFLDDNRPIEDQDSKEHTLKAAMTELAGKPPSSDLLMWLNAFIQHLKIPTKGGKREFCERYRLMSKRMEEMTLQYYLLKRVICQIYPNTDYNEDLKLTRSSSEYLRRMISESINDRVAERVSNPRNVPGLKRLPFPAFRLLSRPSDDPAAYVYLHPTSILRNMPPPLLVYTDLITSTETRYIKYNMDKLPDTDKPKAPPHMRHHLRVSSPSDNLSPCSQKLMVDLVKGPKPRSFSSMLAQQPSKLAETQLEMQDVDSTEDREEPPASPTKNIGGMTL